MKKRVMAYIHAHSGSATVDEVWANVFDKSISKKKVEKLYEKCMAEIIDNIFNSMSVTK